MTLRFVKMHGAANDFVVLDHRAPFLPADARALFARLCDRRRGVGADGVLLLENDPEHDFAMRYHNADGGEAEFCGNGARCIARFALDLGLGRDGAVTFRTAAGVKSARSVPDGRIALEFGRVSDGERVRLESGGRTVEGRLVGAGVPHLVVPVADVSGVPLAEVAPPLRHHARFAPAGANVDFVALRPDGRCAMRTYERGVEGETLACGSGAIASALWAVLDAGARSPVTVRTAGGDDLVVRFDSGPGGREATLTGPAEIAFRGEWTDARG
ncbi:MAG: diaminopimelate epimerase [Candidatus Eisenbacteria bacterium]|nr:diaminopimelate epimerase [Candidatus Eisenbacteria bacterium]